MAAQLSSSFLGKLVPFSVSFLLENGSSEEGANLPSSFHKLGCEDQVK